MFAGLYCRWPDGKPDQYADAAGLLASLTPHHTPDRSGHWADGPFLAVQALTFNTPESRFETIPHRCPRSGEVIFAWARLDNRVELLRDLGTDERRWDALTDPALILAAHQRWGTRAVERLEGDFAYVVLSPASGKVYAARDALGTRPLFYRLEPGLFAFSTSVATFHRLVGVSRTPSESWMLRYLAVRSASSTATALAEVMKLPPGHWLEVDREGWRMERYHGFSDDAPWSWRRDPRWVESYRRQLEESTRCRLRSAYPLAAESSGGLDSSSIVGLIAHLRPDLRASLHTFGYAHYAVEPGLILTTSQRHLLGSNHILTGFPEEDAPERVLDVLGQPPEQNNATVHAPFYRMCKGFGIRTLFSGFGGDEAVTNQGALLLNELADRGAWLSMLRELPGPWWQRPPRLAKRLWNHARRRRFNPVLQRSLGAYWQHLPLNRSAVERLGLETEFMGHAAHDAPYRTINAFILGNRLQAMVSTRLENGVQLAASHGVEYRWPLLDRRLIGQYLATPAIEKYAAGMGRYLHRRAVADLLPDPVCWKPSKSVGANALLRDDWSEMRLRLLPRARRLLKESHPAAAGLLDMDKMTEMVANAEAGGGDLPFYFAFLYTVRHCAWLDDWLRRYFP